MPLSLFGHEPKRVVTDNLGRESGFAHTFGGQAKDFGLTFRHAPHPLHLVYRIHLADSLAPIEAPNFEFLPLCYGFAYGPECCYRVLSDVEVELVAPREEPYFPPWKAPPSFPRSPTSFTPSPYDEHKAEDALRLKGVFGWKSLARDERERALKLAREHSGYTLADAVDEDWTYEDVINCMYHPPFVQGKPSAECPNPDCRARSLQVIGVQDHPLPGELIWPDAFVQTIWQMCGECRCIVASNQCT